MKQRVELSSTISKMNNVNFWLICIVFQKFMNDEEYVSVVPDI